MEGSVVVHPNLSLTREIAEQVVALHPSCGLDTTGMGFIQRICVYNALLYSHCYRNQTSVVSSKLIAIFPMSNVL